MERPELRERIVQFLKAWQGWLLLGLFLLIVVLVLAALAWAGVIDTGFGEYTPPTPGSQRAKTLWEWMELLLVPLVLVLGVAMFTWVTGRRGRPGGGVRALGVAFFRGVRGWGGRGAAPRPATEMQEIEVDRAREAALQTYLDRITELTRDGLLASPPGDAKRSMARAQTLTVLRQLDGERKGVVLQFLYESGLIGTWNEKEGRQEAFVDLSEANLSGANLTVALPGAATRSDASLSGAKLSGVNLSGALLIMANLRGANLREANLSGSNLNGADLSGANLWDADLSRANLHEANLREANLNRAILIMVNLRAATLSGASLQEANLVGAHLTGALLDGANLSRANVTWANLKGVKVTEQQLAQTNSLKGATLPDGTKHE